MSFVKLATGFFVLVLSVIILFSVKESENIEFLVTHEMLSCEGCDHLIVVDSTKKSLVGQSLVFISNKDIAKKTIDFAISHPKSLTCVKGKLFFIGYTFGLIDPKGRRVLAEDYGDKERCSNIKDS